MQRFDAIIIGAGAAGLFCAGIAGQRGRRVLLLDHAAKVAEKIRISGGGRCNFTNLQTAPGNFLSENPDFCRSALARYTPADFLALLRRHGIAWHEKHRGQLFCDHSSDEIIRMLLRECDAGGVARWQPCKAGAVTYGNDGYEVATERGPVQAPNLVIATGGLSIPKIGASEFGYGLARQFGLAIVPTRPGLVPLTFAAAQWEPFAALSGLSVEAEISTGDGAHRVAFVEDVLFTHRGLSGPGILQISSHWHAGTPLTLSLAPGRDLGVELVAHKRGSRRKLANVLAELLPQRLADTWLAQTPAWRERPIADMTDRDLRALGKALQGWRLVPNGTEGYRKAEVTAGGVSTRALSSQSMQSLEHPGLHVIGEVVDVTGWLGGYNFQWAWASAAACARALGAA